MQNIKIILWEKRESSAVNKYGLDTKNVKCFCLVSVTLKIKHTLKIWRWEQCKIL